MVRSPVAGRINRVLVTTPGSAITAGQPLVEIVPTSGGLAIDARVSAQDIGSVRINQPARIAITAYEQAVHGTLEGRVVTISPDSIIDERTGAVFYEVRVVADRATLNSPTGQRLTIEPGMVAEVNLLGEKRSVLSYILSPITRLGERAFRE
jgi:adhesin transport system membrane fusion protein